MVVNAAIVVPEEDQAQLVPQALQEGLEIQEPLDPQDSQESLNKHLANKSQRHHASRVQEVNQVSQGPLDHLASREARGSLVNQEDKHLQENQAQQDHLDRQEHLANLAVLVSLEHLHSPKKPDLHLLAHQETLEHLVSLEIQDQQDSLAVREDLDQRDLQAHLANLETTDLLASLGPLEHLAEQERKESVPNIAQSTVVSSSRMELDDVKCRTNKFKK